MSKYVIDIPGKYYKANVLIMGTDCGKIITEQHERNELPELTPEYINEHFSDLHEGEYEVAYQKGLEDAWECARKIATDADEGGLLMDEVEKIFGIRSVDGTFNRYTVQEAIAKLQAYEEQQKAAEDEITVGDEIIYTCCDGMVRFVVWEISDDRYEGTRTIKSDSLGSWTWVKKKAKGIKKTGRHFPEVAELLEKMKGGAE